MTAHAMKGDQERCLAGGMDGYVSKPIRTSEFFAIIEKLTGTSRPKPEQVPANFPKLSPSEVNAK